MLYPKSELAKKTLFYVILCSSFFTLLATFTQLYFAYQDEIENVSENISFVKKSYMGAISSSLYELDVEQLHALLTGILAFKDIKYLEVKDSIGKGSVIATAGNADYKADLVIKFPIEFKSPGRGIQQIGEISIYSTYDNAQKKVISNLTTIIITNAIKTFLASFVIYLILNHLITNHLIEIVRVAKKLKDLPSGEVFKLNRKRGRKDDELDILIKTLNSAHIDNINYLKQIERHQANLETLVEERTKELKATHSKMVEMAHQAGMAEIATGTVHNLGNGLNSLGVKLEMILSENEKFHKIYQQLCEEICQINKPPKVSEELHSICEIFSEANQSFEKEIEKREVLSGKIKENLSYLHKVIYAQQSAAKNITGFSELIDLAETIELSSQLVKSSKSDLAIVNINFPKEPIRIRGNKTKLVQILINLIENAFNAYEKTLKDEFLVRIDVSLNEQEAIVSVTDFGCGIHDSDKNKIFSFGYTTRDWGHGFGLHHSASLASELGGSISFQSRINEGTTFKLCLPRVDI